jgi:DNA-binding PadR family transcriptional regulator
MKLSKDKILYHPARLSIVAHLLRCGGSGTWSAIWRATDTNPGNIAAHFEVLENAGAVTVLKEIVGKRVRTTVVLTDAGRQAFADHMAAMKAITEPSMMVEATP